jgi:hypothetical protein
MDWHKLQQTLFALDPTDPREDLAKLRAAAQGSAVKEVKETIDYLNESAQVPQGSLAMDRDYSVADFAALAGVRLDERQKPADQVRGTEPMPKAKPGRTDHPFKDRLVGEEEIDEGPLGNIAAKAKAGFAAGRAAPQGFNAAQAAYRGELPADSAPKKPKPQKIKGGVTGAQLSRQLGIQDPTIFNQAIQRVKQGQPLGRPHQAAMSDAFVKLMAMDSQKTQQILQLLRRMEASDSTEELSKEHTPTNIQKSGQDVHKGKQYESIKDMLYAKLAEKK